MVSLINIAMMGVASPKPVSINMSENHNT